MSLTEDKLEILIGKYLDGQATPIEQHLIEREMNQNPRAKELCEQWRMLSEWGRSLVVDKVVGQGARPEDVFEQAWRRSRGFSWLRLAKPRRHVRFAVGMAASFLLGTILTLVWTNGTTGEDPLRRGPVAKETVAPTRVDRQAMNSSVAAVSQSESRNVPYYYNFTDNAGNQYVIQRVQKVQEGKVRPAAYYGL
jgi:anti-sigma factor RsiW